MVPYLSLYPGFSTMKPLLCLSKKFIENRTIPVLVSQSGFWFRPARNWQKQIVIPAEAGIQKQYT
jgi:hypothetical protein